MKKKLIILITLTLAITGICIFQGESASYWREYYQNTNTKKHKKEINQIEKNEQRTTEVIGKYRQFSNRVGPYNYQQPTRSRLLHDARLDFSHVTQRHDTNGYDSYRQRIIPAKKAKELFKITHPNLYPRYENTIASGKNVVRQNNEIFITNYPINSQNNWISTHTKTKYSIAIPSDFQLDQNGIYRSRKISLAFRIQRINQTNCTQSSFQTCAINLGKDFRSKQKINISKMNNQELRWEKTVQNESNTYPTYAETFEAETLGQKNIYSILTVYDPITNSLVKIESVSKKSEQEKTAMLLQKIWNSFQFQIS